MNHSTGLLNDLRGEKVASDGVIDTAGCEGVIFIAVFGTAAGTNKMVLKVGDESDGSDAVAVNDSKDRDVAAEILTAASEPIAMLEHHKPEKRYCKVTLTGAATMVAIKYGHRKMPAVQDAAKAIAASFVSPYAA